MGDSIITLSEIEIANRTKLARATADAKQPCSICTVMTNRVIHIVRHNGEERLVFIDDFCMSKFREMPVEFHGNMAPPVV